MNHYEFGQRIKARRKELGLTQLQLAALAGIRGEKMCRIERGTGRIDAVSDIPRLCDALRVMPEWFWIDYKFT